VPQFWHTNWVLAAFAMVEPRGSYAAPW
jgi:hypothetical protein